MQMNKAMKDSICVYLRQLWTKKRLGATVKPQRLCEATEEAFGSAFGGHVLMDQSLGDVKDGFGGGGAGESQGIGGTLHDGLAHVYVPGDHAEVGHFSAQVLLGYAREFVVYVGGLFFVHDHIRHEAYDSVVAVLANGFKHVPHAFFGFFCKYEWR